MSSTFFGFNIARSGLFASQRALNITGHNIANANTPGYSRQRLTVIQSNPMTLPGGQGMMGSGVDTQGIEQLRDQFLDFKIRKENMTVGEWEARQGALQQIEAIFNEPSDSGIRKVMDEFSSSLHELNQHPDNLTARAQVRQRGIALTKTLNHMYNQLNTMQQNTDFTIRTTVSQINTYAEQISNLNKQIFSYELDGSKANDLRDQRNLLIDELSKLVDIQVQEVPQSQDANGGDILRVLLNGIPIVNHISHQKLTTTPREDNDPAKNYVDAPRLLNITWENGTAFHCKSGKIKGLLDARDNMLGNEKGIPYYMDKLNRFTTVFTARFNMQHGQGYGLNGTGNENQFFNGPALDYVKYPGVGLEEVNVSAFGASDEEKISGYENAMQDNTTIFKADDGKWYKVEIIHANTISIASNIENDLNSIAAALTVDATGLTGLAGDGSNALKLNELRHDVNMFTWGSPDDFFKSLISNLGVDGQEAVRMVDNQRVLINQIDEKRQSISGVSLDEEMANMVKFQHSYNASARMITTVDEMLDKIINSMGLVGR